MKCKSCQSAELSALRPAALRKKLSNYGDIPADEINAKIASREAASSQRRKKAARRRWADAHFAKNKATFDEMNADKQRFRSRATYLAQKGAPLASAAYRDYSDLLANAVTLYRLRAKDGLAPYAPWYEGLYQSSMLYEWLMRVVNALEHASHDEAESKRMNGIFPVWWGERERMLAHKSRPKHEEGAAQQATEASPDFDHLVAAARSQWTKRNMGTKVPRKTKPPPAPRTRRLRRPLPPRRKATRPTATTNGRASRAHPARRNSATSTRSTPTNKADATGCIPLRNNGLTSRIRPPRPVPT
jgi:hypothetical protein